MIYRGTARDLQKLWPQVQKQEVSCWRSALRTPFSSYSYSCCLKLIKGYKKYNWEISMGFKHRFRRAYNFFRSSIIIAQQSFLQTTEINPATSFKSKDTNCDKIYKKNNFTSRLKLPWLFSHKIYHWSGGWVDQFRTVSDIPPTERAGPQCINH